MTPQPRPVRLSSWGSRVGAALLDGMILWGITMVAIMVAAIVAAPFGGPDDIAGPLWLLFSFLGVCGYYGGTMTRQGEHNGQTLGKQAAGIRVVRDDGKPISAGTVAAREVGLKFIGGSVTFGVGYVIDCLWPLGERQNRALHDLAVHTHVVDTTPAPAPMPVQLQAPPWGAPRPQLAPAIARHVYAAQNLQVRIGETVQRAQLPYVEVCHEVNSLVGLMHQSAQRAQMLHDALAESPPARIEHRLAELDGSGKTELIEALQHQLTVQRRMEAQLERYGDELERVVVELDTVRGNLLSVSASTDAHNQQRLADEVRQLRDEMSSIADGVSEAYG
jgi:uncharacterized RDD family membrane protein YckC